VLKILLALTLLGGFASARAETLLVAADVWCPYNCQPNSELPGYMVEILNAAFPQKTVEYRVLPWKRALLESQQQKIVAVLGIPPSEAVAQQLKVGKELLGMEQSCVYVAAGNPWRYQGRADDLNSFQQVYAVLGYEYAEGMREWMSRGENKDKLFLQSGESPAQRNLQKLLSKRQDFAVMESRAVVEYLLRDEQFAGKVVNAGCFTPTPLTVGFAPDYPQVDELLAQLDQTVRAMRKSGQLAKILAKYGLKDWQ
jgi:polar amino acid transport system substrate-binding protein